MHEFEALLFNIIEAFGSIFKANEYDKSELLKVLENFPDPELINQEKETSPSHRLKHLIPSYEKIIDGNTLAEMIGLEQIRKKNKHFNDWIEQLRK